MNLFAKKSFQFDHPAGAEPAVVVQAQSFATVPEWVEQSLMYKLAVRDDAVTRIDSKADELAAETGRETAAQKKARLKAEAEAEAAKKSDEEEAARISAENEQQPEQ